MGTSGDGDLVPIVTGAVGTGAWYGEELSDSS